MLVHQNPNSCLDILVDNPSEATLGAYQHMSSYQHSEQTCDDSGRREGETPYLHALEQDRESAGSGTLSPEGRDVIINQGMHDLMDHQVLQQWLPETEPEVTQPATLARDQALALCSAFFEKVYEDQRIPHAVKAVIGRLIIPYTKFALRRGPGFLFRPEHPARLLIELMWDIGRTLYSEEKVELQLAYQDMVFAVGEIKSQESPVERDFLRAYYKLCDYRPR